MKKISGDKVKWGILGVGDVCEVKSAPAMSVPVTPESGLSAPAIAAPLFAIA